MNRSRWLTALALLALMLTCVMHEEAADGPRAQAPPLHASTFAQENPLRLLLRAADAAAIRARVVQRIVAGPYTYLALRPDDGHALRWAVTLGRGEPVHAHVRLRSLGHAHDFYSPRLDRTFPELLFGTVARIE